MANASATQQHQSVVVAYSLTGVWRRCIRCKTRPVSKDAGLLHLCAWKDGTPKMQEQFSVRLVKI